MLIFLNIKVNGVRHDNSQTRQGVEYYSEKENDLGNQESFEDYMELLKEVFDQVFNLLVSGRYSTIIISDFTVDERKKNSARRSN